MRQTRRQHLKLALSASVASYAGLATRLKAQSLDRIDRREFKTRITTDDFTKPYLINHGMETAPAIPVMSIGIEMQHGEYGQRGSSMEWHGVYLYERSTREDIARKLEQLAEDIRSGKGARGEEVRSTQAVNWKDVEHLFRA